MADDEIRKESNDSPEKFKTDPETLIKVREELEILSRGTAEIISKEELIKKLVKSKTSGKPLKIKLGIDPTAPHVHLGFAVVLRKMRQFQDMGHRIQLIIGDFTARVGDPTGRNLTRKVLTPDEIEENAKTYRDQLSIILDPEKTDVRFNSQWLAPLKFEDIIELCSRYTVARMLERDDFSNRYKNGVAIGMHEFLYPLMQGYDSVALQSDVEMGGTDQKFNILVGRDLQREYGQEPQVVFLMPILEGTDGKLKMSKSYGNYVGITEQPEEMFGKIMSIPDELIPRYFELCTDFPLTDIKIMSEKMERNEINPRDVKMRLAEEIITIYHDRESAREAREEFLKVFSRKELPSKIPEVKIPAGKTKDGKISIIKLLKIADFASSNREAKRLINQGAVKIDGSQVDDHRANVEIPQEGKKVLQVGSRNFADISLEQ